VPIFADIGCRVVSATDPYGHIIDFLDLSLYFFFQAALQLYSRSWEDPHSRPTTSQKSGSSGNRTRTSGFIARNWPLDHRGGHYQAYCTRTTATDYGLDDRGVGARVPIGSRIFISPCRPDRLWGPPNLLPNGYRRLFPRRKSCRGVRLTTDLQLTQMSRKRGSIQPLPYMPLRRSASLVKHRENCIFTGPR
jgi:hypothetical protein